MKANTPDDLDELYDSLPDNERLTASVLRDIIRTTLPRVREKKSYGAPFYFGRRALCYVWPASITWGGKRQGTGVNLGFHRARGLDHGGRLAFGKRKDIGQCTFDAAEEIDVVWVTDMLQQAWALDQAN